jgi:hypothetical protein
MSSQAVQDKAERGRLIEEAAQEFPEYSYLDKEQERIYEEARERGPNMSYPEYEGPGFTEPAINDPGLHVDHSEYEREHYWDQPERSTDEMSDEEINALALPFEEAEPPENEPDEPAGPDGYGPHDDTWSYDDRTSAEVERDNAAGEAVAARHQAEADDAEQFEQYYGEPPTPAAEDREPGE